MAMYFTSDWHIGEKPAPNTPSFLRPEPTEVMAERWLAQCHQLLKPGDDLYFLGDLAVTPESLNFYRRLPKGLLIFLVCGDKEANIKEELYADGIYGGIFDNIYSRVSLTIGNTFWIAMHKPEDILDDCGDRPALCGHVHGIWRTQCMPNGQPIINVGIDAWGGLVSEEHIMHQYDAITKGYYDRNARVDLWKI